MLESLKILYSGFWLSKILNSAKIFNSGFWLSKMLKCAKILSSGFQLSKILKSAKILTSGFWPSKLCIQFFGFPNFSFLFFQNFEFTPQTFRNLKVGFCFFFSVSKIRENLEFRILAFQNLEFRFLTVFCKLAIFWVVIELSKDCTV